MLQAKATAQQIGMPTNMRRHNFRMLSYVAFGLIALLRYPVSNSLDQFNRSTSF